MFKFGGNSGNMKSLASLALKLDKFGRNFAHDEFVRLNYNDMGAKFDGSLWWSNVVSNHGKKHLLIDWPSIPMALETGIMYFSLTWVDMSKYCK